MVNFGWFRRFLWFLFTNFTWRRNVCSSYWGYIFRDISRSCWASPDMGTSVPQVIERNIGKYETHNVTTEDGYILTIFRLPRSNPKGVVVLQHTYMTDSSIYLIQHNNSNALVFYNAGYDVWLPNNRNTRYSQNHVSVKSSENAYWDFSFHEQGVYDHRAVFRYIREQTGGRKLYFVGHSLGSTTALVYASTYPEEAQETIKMFFLLAPIAQLKHVTSPAKCIVSYYPAIKEYNDREGHTGEAFHYEHPGVRLTRFMAINLPIQLLFVTILNILSGWNPKEFDPAIINMLMAVTPSGGSWKTVYHLAQLEASKRFQMYDYGPEENTNKYGTMKPPLYPIEKIKAPIFLMHFEKDTLSVEEDVEILYSMLPKKARGGKMLIEGMNHVDFVTGKERRMVALDTILQAMERHI